MKEEKVSGRIELVCISQRVETPMGVGLMINFCEERRAHEFHVNKETVETNFGGRTSLLRSLRGEKTNLLEVGSST